MSRVENVGRNSIWQVAATVLATLLGFIGRVLFMRILGEEYLGISDLYVSIIGVLSFVDLGLSSAFTFCFYKPIAQQDTGHIQALLYAFRKVIRVIGTVITAAGLLILPFLDFLVKDAANVDSLHLRIYYLISLSNTVISYWLMYKTCYITARQEAWRLVPFTMMGNLVMVLLQVAALLTTGNYTAWACSAVIASILQRVVMDRYIRRHYPETELPGVTQPLPEEDKRSIIDNVKGILMHKIGSICVTQTDNIIVSSCISISTTGLLSNYVLIRTTICNFIGLIQNSLVATMGDLMAREKKEVQLNVFYTYMMVNYWMVGFAMCGVGVLSTPFVALVFGPDKILDDWTILFSCMGFYFAYQTYALNLLPTAGGKFILGAGCAIIEGLSNLVISLAAVWAIGLPGVFLGTVLSQVINYLLRPFPIFKGMYGDRPWNYFKLTIPCFLTAMVPYLLLLKLRSLMFPDGYTVGGFILLGMATVLVFAVSVPLFWHRNRYFKEAYQLIRGMVVSRLKK